MTTLSLTPRIGATEPPTSADIVIIGSGMGGATLAWALRDSGARVVVLERGDFLAREAQNWEPREVFERDRYKTQERWLDGQGKEFRPGMQYYVGGNTKVYGASLARFRESDFTAVEHADGLSPAWPFSYADLEPYYSAAEQLYLVHGNTGEDPTDPPRSAPFPYPAVEDEPVIARLRTRLTAAGYGAAHLPIGIDLRQDGSCVRCATCDGFPCLVDAKADADVRAMRPAIRAGVTLVRGAHAQQILTSADGSRATGVQYLHNGQMRRLDAAVVVVSAGAVNSAALLLRSTSSAHPSGLANRSDLVGRHYMVHNNTVVSAFGLGVNRTRFQKTLYVNDFYDKGNARHPYPLGHVQLIGKTQAAMYRSAMPLAPRSALTLAAEHSTDWWLFTEDLPDPRNRAVPAGDRVQVHYRPNNVTAHRELLRETKRMLHRGGYPLVVGRQMGISVNSHQAGTVRAGSDPATSVLDPHCRSHDVRGLLVVDSSFFPSLPVMNPALTIAANALRVAPTLLADLGQATSTSTTSTSTTATSASGGSSV